MKLSAKSRYAARILLELARQTDDVSLSATILSQRTGVSVQFVEQILKPLKQSGLTKSKRGATGGHKLAMPPNQITLGQVIRLMEKGVYLTVCCGEQSIDCPRKQGCLTRKAWVSLSQSLERELDAISLADLLHDDQICPEQHVTDGETKKKSATTPPKRTLRPVITRRTKKQTTLPQ